MATTPPDGSVVNGDPTSPAVNNDGSKDPQAAAPLSASAMSFNPGETNGSANPTTTNATDGSSSTELLSPSAVLWGIGSQSYSGKCHGPLTHCCFRSQLSIRHSDDLPQHACSPWLFLPRNLATIPVYTEASGDSFPT